MLDTFNDGMLKSAVQELTTKVVKLAKKMMGVESKVAELENLTGLPDIANADRGKTLKVKSNNNEAHWVAVPEVPTPAVADEGKGVKVNSSGAYELVSMPTVPTPAVADSGKVVKVNSSGAYELGEAGGGSGNVLQFQYVEDAETPGTYYPYACNDNILPTTLTTQALNNLPLLPSVMQYESEIISLGNGHMVINDTIDVSDYDKATRWDSSGNSTTITTGTLTGLSLQMWGILMLIDPITHYLWFLESK